MWSWSINSVQPNQLSIESGDSLLQLLKFRFPFKLNHINSFTLRIDVRVSPDFWNIMFYRCSDFLLRIISGMRRLSSFTTFAGKRSFKTTAETRLNFRNKSLSRWISLNASDQWKLIRFIISGILRIRFIISGSVITVFLFLPLVPIILRPFLLIPIIVVSTLLIPIIILSIPIFSTLLITFNSKIEVRGLKTVSNLAL